MPGDQPGEVEQDIQVALDRRRHARPLDLDHDLLAALQTRRVNLANRRSGQRRRVERGEDLLWWRAELGERLRTLRARMDGTPDA